ncbi:MAG: metal ABC transporter ATP-binding protein, partial [Caldilineae bacterium]
AGKSTLFGVIAGTIKPTSGEVRIYGSGPDEHICIGYVPQRNKIDWRFPVTVWDAVMMGRASRIGLLRRPGPRDRQRVQEALEEVGLAELTDRQIGELSGGQQQRVFLARALAQEAELLLLDEPLTGLDAPSQNAIRNILARLRERGIGIIVATHDLNQAAQLYERVLLLNRRLLADGPPAQILTTEMLSQAFGNHLSILPTPTETLALRDECCSDEEMATPLILTPRGRRSS